MRVVKKKDEWKVLEMINLESGNIYFARPPGGIYKWYKANQIPAKFHSVQQLTQTEPTLKITNVEATTEKPEDDEEYYIMSTSQPISNLTKTLKKTEEPKVVKIISFIKRDFNPCWKVLIEGSSKIQILSHPEMRRRNQKLLNEWLANCLLSKTDVDSIS